MGSWPPREGLGPLRVGNDFTIWLLVCYLTFNQSTKLTKNITASATYTHFRPDAAVPLDWSLVCSASSRTSVAFLQELNQASKSDVCSLLKVYAVGVPPADARWLRLRLRPRRPGAAVPVARDAPLPCAAAREACAASVASRSSFVSSGRSELRSVTCHACVRARTMFWGDWMARAYAYRVCYKT